MNISIKKTVRSDGPYIVDFQLKMAWETESIHLDKAVVEAGVSAVFDDPSKGFYLLVRSGEEAIASMLLTPEWSDWRNGMIWWIQSVYVPVEFRRKGVFRALYRHVESLVKDDQNACGLRLYVEKNNARAIQTYRDLQMSEPGYLVMESLTNNG